MATSDILGLFTTPEQYQLAQRQAQDAEALQYAQLDPRSQAQYGFYRAGQQLGGAIGGALGGTDPMLQKISQRQQLIGMIDPSNPDTYPQAIEAALRGGDQEAAFLLRNEMMKAKEQSAIAEARGFEREKFLLDRGTGIRDRGMAANALELSKGLIKADGTVDEAVYNELLGYGQIGSAIIDQRLKATQGLKTVQVQNIAKGLFNADGTPNLQIVAELRKTPEGRKILEENAPKTMSVKGDETIMTVPVLGEESKVIKQGEKPVPFTGDESNAALTLYQTNDPVKIFNTYGQAGLDAVAQKAEAAGRRKTPVTKVTIENKMQEGFGVNLTETITSNIKAGRLARPILGAVDSMQILLDEGVRTGFGQETMLQVGKVGQVFNPDFNVKGLAGQEALQSIATNLVLPQVKQLGVNPTDTDLKFINTGSPSLSKTVAGNKLMLSALRLKGERDQDLSKFTNSWLSQNSRLTTSNPTEAFVKFNSDFDAYTQSSPLYAPSASRLREQFNALGSTTQRGSGRSNARDATNRGGLTTPSTP
jgi:hypothetical protein